MKRFSFLKVMALIILVACSTNKKIIETTKIIEEENLAEANTAALSVVVAEKVQIDLNQLGLAKIIYPNYPQRIEDLVVWMEESWQSFSGSNIEIVGKRSTPLWSVCEEASCSYQKEPLIEKKPSGYMIDITIGENNKRPGIFLSRKFKKNDKIPEILAIPASEKKEEKKLQTFDYIGGEWGPTGENFSVFKDSLVIVLKRTGDSWKDIFHGLFKDFPSYFRTNDTYQIWIEMEEAPIIYGFSRDIKYLREVPQSSFYLPREAFARDILKGILPTIDFDNSYLWVVNEEKTDPSLELDKSMIGLMKLPRKGLRFSAPGIEMFSMLSK